MYRNTLKKGDEDVPSPLKVRIKNVLDNQRAALEFLASQLFSEYGDGSDAQVYYPVANEPTQFEGIFNKYLPGVAENCPGVRDAIEKRQGYQPGYEWLPHLVRLTNENKHARLTRQNRTLLPVTKFEREGASIVVHGTAYIEEGPEAPPEQELKRTEHGFQEDWFFEDPPVLARATLITIQKELPRLVGDVLASLP